MTTSVRGVRRFLGWSLLGTCSLLLVLTAYNLASLSRGLAGQEEEALARARTMGERARAELSLRGFLNPGPDGMTLLAPGRDPSGEIYPRQVAVRFGSNLLWALPPFAPPRVAEPPMGATEVSAEPGDLLVYACRLEDGRLFLATFDAPALRRARSRTTALVAFEVAAVGLLILFWALLAWRLHTSYRDVVATLRQADDLLARPPGEMTPQDVLTIFDKTVSELRARTRELERINNDNRQKAEDVGLLAEKLCANLATAYLLFDGEGRLTRTHPDARQLLGLPDVPRLGESEGRTLGGLPAISALVREAREGRALATREEVPGARGRLLQAIAIPLTDQLNRSRGVLLVLRDMTDFYAMARTVRERESLSRLGEVAAGVAHEVRNGLNVLTLQFQLLEKDHPALGSDARLAGVRREMDTLGQVVHNLLVFARPLKPEKTAVAAAPLLETTAETLRRLFPGLRVETAADEELVLQADAEALGRALFNLGRNAAEAAREAHPDSGRVRLAGRATQDGGAEIVVEDDGAGLSQAARESLFAPFCSTKPGGTGLGLPIARKIAREHGGELEGFEGTLPGAAFRLTLPG